MGGATVKALCLVARLCEVHALAGLNSPPHASHLQQNAGAAVAAVGPVAAVHYVMYYAMYYAMHHLMHHLMHH